MDFYLQKMEGYACLVTMVMALGGVYSQTVEPITTLCRSGICLAMYRAGRGDDTWEESRRECLHRGIDLATIPDRHRQDHMEATLGQASEPLGESDRVWVGGERAEDPKWRRPGLIEEGTEFREANIIDMHIGFCIRRLLTEDRFAADECTEGRGQMVAMCQTSGPEYEGKCTVDQARHTFEFGGICYYTSDKIGTWYDAQNFCNSAARGVLAYTGVQEQKFIEQVKSLREPIVQSMWIGVRKHWWEWLDGFTSRTPVLFHNWARMDRRYPHKERVTENRIYIRRDGKWEMAANTDRARYFLCQYLDNTWATTMVNIVTDPQHREEGVTDDDRSATTLVDGVTDPESGETGDPGAGERNIALFGGAAAGVIVVFIIAVAVVIGTRKRQQRARNNVSFTNNARETGTRDGNIDRQLLVQNHYSPVGSVHDSSVNPAAPYEEIGVAHFAGNAQQGAIDSECAYDSTTALALYAQPIRNDSVDGRANGRQSDHSIHDTEDMFVDNVLYGSGN